MYISETSKQSIKLTTPEENREPKTVFSSTQPEEQANSSIFNNDAMNTRERQHRTELLQNSPSKNNMRMGPPCDIDDQSRYDLDSLPTRKFLF